MSQVRMKLDIRSGLIEIDCEAKEFDKIADQAAVLLAKFKSVGVELPETGAESGETDNQSRQTQIEENNNREAKAPKRRAKGSSKTKNYKLVDGLLSEPQRKELREYFAEKAPRNQNEKVAVLVFKLKEFAKAEDFSDDEIFTLFQTVNEKTPGNLKAVLGNMTGEGLGNQKDGKFRLSFKGDDLVKHDLPVKPKNE